MRDVFVATEAGEIPHPPMYPFENWIWGKGWRMPDGIWTCIGLDPGGTTGWCVLRIHNIAMQDDEYRILENVVSWSVGQIIGPTGHQIDKVVDLAECWPDAEIVCEDFNLRQLRGGRELLDPVRIMEPLKWWLERGGRRAWDTEEGEDWKPRELHLQQPALAMTTITDQRLRLIGVLSMTAGQPHARDAMRHALTFARRRKLIMTGAVQ